MVFDICSIGLGRCRADQLCGRTVRENLLANIAADRAFPEAVAEPTYGRSAA